MSRADRVRWDERYADTDEPATDAAALDPVFTPYQQIFPTAGHTLDVACGQGLGAVWLARRGLDVWGLDVSAVAIDRARDLARRSGVGDRCRFAVVDLDAGLPTGPPVDVLYCRRFRDARLDRAMAQRLAPGGLLAITALMRGTGCTGPFRVAPGELPAVFADLDPIAGGEGDGHAWLLARRVVERPAPG